MIALVADDAEEMRMLVVGLLKPMYTVLEAKDGREALQGLRSCRDAGLAVLDWDMPKMQGVDVIRAIRKDPALRGVKVLMMTSHVDREDISEALDAGADEYIMKPFLPQMLFDKLRMLGLPTL